MIDFKITVDTQRAIVDLTQFKRQLPDWNARGIAHAAVYLVGVVQKHFLRGPRPEKLGVRTGRLINSIDSETKRQGDDTVAYIGSNAKGDRGENYPKYWEYDGSRHGGPRPFLNPAVQQYQDKWMEVWRKDLEVSVNRYAR